MEQLAADEVKTLTEETLTKLLRNERTDVFSFADHLQKQQAAWWKQNKNSWREILPECTWSVTVDAVIVTEGQEMSPRILDPA